MNQKFGFRKGAAALMLLVMLTLAAPLLYTQAFWDENSAVHIDAEEIENSTLAIGTHLVHLSALNDSIYEVAQASAEESGQNQIYYKSELGGSIWFNITSATSLADITTQGTPMKNEEMEALFFTHHTKSDKITYDLRTGEAVNIFDIRDPYDLETLEEMMPLKIYQEEILELKEENHVTRRIDEVWETNVTSPPEGVEVEGLKTKDEYEKQMAALQNYLKVLNKNDAEATETGKVNVVMETVDACRRYLVFANLEKALEAYLDELGNAGSFVETEDGQEVIDEDTDPELISALTESLGNVRSSMITCAGEMLSEGVSVMSKTVYQYSVALIEDAVAGNHASCDKDVQNLLHLDNIQNDVISQKAAELAFLENELIPLAEEEYLKGLGQGESPDYMLAVQENRAQAMLNRFLDEQDGLVSTRRGELEFLLEAKCKRTDTQSAMDFIKAYLERTTATFTSVVRDDDFKDVCLASVEEYITYLTDKMRELELALGGNEMDKLMAEKEDLQTQRLSALDKNDLAAAKELERKIEALEEKIRAQEDELAAQIAALQAQINSLEDGDPTKTEAEAQMKSLQNSLSDGSLGSMTAQMKNKALASIKSGSSENAQADVNALAGMLSASPTLVLPAMQEVYHALKLNGGDESLIETVEQAILQSPAVLKDDTSADEIRKIVEEHLMENNAGSSNGGGSGSGTGNGGGSGIGTGTGDGSGITTGADGQGTLLSIGGISLRDARQAASVIIALHLYYEETGNRAALQVMESLAQEQISLGNPMLYERINDTTGEYIPLTCVQVLTGRRFVWNKNDSLGVLAQGSDYYGFTLYSDTVLRDRNGEKTEHMLRSAKYLYGIHIPEEYVYDQFGVQTVYLSNMTLGCACDDEMLKVAQERLTQLLSAG